jgi:simple sugar transport system ATP-binding protein
MDEPTAVLAPQEIDELIETMKALVATGKSIIFISHKLQEVTAVADRVTVLRKGVVTAEGVDSSGMTKRDLANLMVGRDVVFTIQRTPHDPGDVILDVKDVRAENNKGVPALRGVSLQVHSGEILGIAGVSGNGQSELAEVITGMRECTGSIRMNGEEIANKPPINSIKSGIAHVPEDRTHVGSAPSLSITDNTIMKSYREQPVGKGWSINSTYARENAVKLKEQYGILAPSVDTMARKLSGGNLQKVILAREISAEPKLMVAVQPTRGLDVGAIESIQRLILAQRETGTAVLLVSEELEELLALSDRIAVIYGGEIMGTIQTDEADIDELGLMMTGTRLEHLRGFEAKEAAKTSVSATADAATDASVPEGGNNT